MILKFEFVTRVREIVRVLRGLPPDDAVRQRTLAINEQLARKAVKLRATRVSQEKQREEAALRQVQSVVEEMEQLKESLSAAEVAAVEFVKQIGDDAQAQLEMEWQKRTETLMAEMTQKIPSAEESTPYKADPPVAESFPRESSQEPLDVSQTRTSTVAETRVTPPEG